MSSITSRKLFVARRREHLQFLKSKPSGPRHLLAHNVTPARLLRVALLGDADAKTTNLPDDPGSHPHSTQAMIRELMTLSGNPPHAPLLEMLVARDMHQKQMPSKKGLLAQERMPEPSTEARKTNGPSAVRASPPSSAALQKLLMSASTLEELVRVTVSLTDGADGSLVASKLANLVEPATAALVHETPILDAVIAMNNLAGVFRRLSVPLPVSFYTLALKYAAISRQTASMRQLLMDCRQYQHHFNSSAIASIAYKLGWFTERGWLRPDQEMHRTGAVDVGMRFGAWRRHNALSLLTGWRMAGIPGPGETQDVCIQEFFRFDDVGLVTDFVKQLRFLRASNSLTRLWQALPDHQVVEKGGWQSPPQWSTLSPGCKFPPAWPGRDLRDRQPQRAAFRLSMFLFFITKGLVCLHDSRAALDLALKNLRYLVWQPPRYLRMDDPRDQQSCLAMWRQLSSTITDRFGPSTDAKYLLRFARIYLPKQFARHFEDLAWITMEESLTSIERCLNLKWIPGLPNDQGGLHVREEALKVS
ncbi:MAG: hypothetical protein M1823_000972 [Watsoniomyces obsoletus]|nr:MAG: hypothetical protein M1823_000972 [Watsoniomyces obsoletus]